MRLWSIHPKYLDARGLVALWRESLLARNVLEGKTKAYKNHPQLLRFKNSKDPLLIINNYLKYVYEESLLRGYSFNKDKIRTEAESLTIKINSGQLKYEQEHLLNKLKMRDKKRYNDLVNIRIFEPHPVFDVIEGGIEKWEITGK